MITAKEAKKRMEEKRRAQYSDGEKYAVSKEFENLILEQVEEGSNVLCIEKILNNNPDSFNKGFKGVLERLGYEFVEDGGLKAYILWGPCA